MDINSWFSESGTYEQGLSLYSKLPGCNKILLRNLSKENTTNFLKLKYELKKAQLSGTVAAIPKVVKTAPAEKKAVIQEPLLDAIIQKSAAVSFEKETMAMYPMELHSTYRQRVSDFYAACELKFQLNAVPERDEDRALQIILKLEDLWTKIDRAWMILDHWKDHNRIMPTKENEDFSKLSGVQLVMQRNRLESSISRREKTIGKIKGEVAESPENRTLSNSLNNKLEQLQQLKINLETIRKLLSNE